MTVVFDRWQELQRLLREEYALSVSESSAKNSLEKKLTSAIVCYHNNYIQLLQERDGRPGEPEKKILKDDGFGDAASFVKESVLALCKDFRIVRELIRRNNENAPSEQWSSLGKLIVNGLYENLVEEQIYYKDIMFLMVDVLDIIIAGSTRAADISFQPRSVSTRVLKEFTQREEIKRYCQAVLLPTILAIAKIDTLDLDNPSKAKPLRLSKEASKEERWSVNRESSTALTSLESPNYTKLYSEIFRQYDARKGWADRDSCYMSRQLLKFLGVSESSTYPTFVTRRARRNNVENDINLKFNKILEVSDAFEREHRLDADLEDMLCKLRNIVNTFFSSAFKNLYNMPMSIRVLCKAIELLVMRRFPATNRTLMLVAVGNFLFSSWLLPEIVFQEKMLASGLVGEDHNKSAKVVQDMLQRVIRGEYLTQDVPYKRQANKIIRNLHGSVENYLQEVLNVPEAQVRRLLDKQRDERICSFSACLSFEDMRVLFELILQARDEIHPLNDKLVNRVSRVRDMTDGFEIFKGRQDRQDNKFYGSQQAYVLFTELILPKDLQTDYYKQYVDTYRGDKRKNLLRQVLVNVERLERPAGQPFREYLQSLAGKYRFKKELNSLDRIPIEFKVRYLLAISSGELESLGRELLAEYELRIKTLNYTFNQTKAEFLKAEDNVKRYEQEVNELQRKQAQLRKKKLLNDFIERTKISICLTSPKTREGEIAMRSSSVRNLGPEKEKIWLEFQQSCIHTTLNLQFIKSLTGEPDRKKKDEVGHCPSIRKFVDVFSGLPEVKAALISGNDTHGIKSTFYEFIRYCVDLAKNESKEYRELLEDEQWFEDQLERMLTWRLYQKIYPKGQTYEDAAVYFRMKTLDWLQFEHLNIKECNRVDGLWRLAARDLTDIDQFKTPSEKLECIHSCTQTMTNILMLTSDEAASADTTYPIMVYILLKACPRRLVSNLNFIELFSNSNKMMSQVGYCFIQIKSAITYFEILNETKIHGMSRLAYQKQIYERENEYGIYFLKRRPRCEKKELRVEPLRQLIRAYLQQS